jgi:sugar-specific transcriptional regulator TrmB
MGLASALESLGLAHMEALSYAYLAANPASTGYRVARGIGKPTANVYRALETLERKGLVHHDRGKPPTYRALPPPDMLARLEHEFMERKARAERELAALSPVADDEKLYALKTQQQVLARARVLLAAARRLALIDAPGDAVASLADEVADARSRHVRVVVVTDGEASEHDDTIRSARPLGAVRLVADAREALVASPPNDDGSVREATWTRSPLFGRVLHEALVAEVLYALIERGLQDGLSVDEVESAFERCRKLRGTA